MPMDFKKTQKDLYMPKITPSLIDVPEMVFFMVDGMGNPNTSLDYKIALACEGERRTLALRINV
jgi:hypothetical protein